MRKLRSRGLNDSCAHRALELLPRKVCLPPGLSFSQEEFRAQNSFGLALLLDHSLFISVTEIHQEYYGGQELQLSVRLTHLGPCDPGQVA